MIMGYGRFARNRDDVGGTLDGISAVLGALVVVTPFLCLDTGNAPAAASAFGCGFAIMGLAYLDGPEPESWTRWASGLLGAWVAVSPWILQRSLVPPDVVLAPPMSEPAVSMPVVLGVCIAVAAALDITRAAVGRGRTLPTATALVQAKRPVPAFPVETQRPIHPTEA